MRNFFSGIGEIIVEVLGWIVGVVLVLALLGLVVAIGTAAIGVIVLVVIVGLIVGGIRRLFGLDKKPKVTVRKGRPYRER